MANGNVQNMHAKDQNNKHLNIEGLDSSCAHLFFTTPFFQGDCNQQTKLQTTNALHKS